MSKLIVIIFVSLQSLLILLLTLMVTHWWLDWGENIEFERPEELL
jgi:hypothetical protein